MDRWKMIGRAGEYLVCADLLYHGYRVYFVPEYGLPYDVVMQDEDGRLYKIQVKATCLKERAGKNVYRFNLKCNNIDDVDIFAFVGLDEKVVGYFTKDYISGLGYKHEIVFKSRVHEGEYKDEITYKKYMKLKRDIIKMRNAGYTHDEISEALGISRSTVYKIKNYVDMERERTYLDEYPIEECIRELKNVCKYDWTCESEKRS